MLKLVERIVQLGELLRSEGFAVSTSEVIDAIESLRYLDLMDKSTLSACPVSYTHLDVYKRQRRDGWPVVHRPYGRIREPR